MKIKDMEPQIDALGLTKLEVKLNTKGEVRAFVCAIIYKEFGNWINNLLLDEDYCQAQLVVFDTNGKAYVTYKELVNRNGRFDVQYRTLHDYKACFINKEEMMRRESLDLVNTDHKVEDAIYVEIPET